jgi:hypothetical protein
MQRLIGWPLKKPIKNPNGNNVIRGNFNRGAARQSDLALAV